jgi:hypothetical protein
VLWGVHPSCETGEPSEEVHRVLVEKIFPAQATVVTVEEFMAGQGQS